MLVGDAAHVAPPSGQGINVAFEDAAALAAAVRQHGLGPKVKGVRAMGWHAQSSSTVMMHVACSCRRTVLLFSF